jgi:hypothetical protein
MQKGKEHAEQAQALALIVSPQKAGETSERAVQISLLDVRTGTERDDLARLCRT